MLKAKAPAEVAAPITVPDVKISGKDDGAAVPGDVQVEDLIDAVKEGSSGAGANPLLEGAPDSE